MTNDPLSLAERLLFAHDPEPEHAAHVARLAMQIFQQIFQQKDIEPAAAEILHVAALLHDVGHAFSVSSRDHHIHSEKFILSQSWPGWNSTTISVCARIARLHRKKIFPPGTDLSRQTLNDFAPVKTQLTLQLAAILRVADALDRSHTQSISSVILIRCKDGWHLSTAPMPLGPQEIHGLTKKSDLWEKIHGKLNWREN
jgi:exopolyphosphatase/guanosine-5'-triphosphate,3'-diphosphate pyrophosphatase